MNCITYPPVIICESLWQPDGLSNRAPCLCEVFRYGVYAAVFLYKASCAGALKSGNQHQDIEALTLKFAVNLNDAASSESHVSCRYGRMLKRLWQRRGETIHVDATCAEASNSRSEDNHDRAENIIPVSHRSSRKTELEQGRGLLANGSNASTTTIDNAVVTPFMDDYLFGPFMTEMVGLDFDIRGDGAGGQSSTMGGFPLIWDVA